MLNHRGSSSKKFSQHLNFQTTVFLLDFEVGDKDTGVKAFKCFKCDWYTVMWYVSIPAAKNDALQKIFSFLDNSSFCLSLISNFSFFFPYSPNKAPPIVAEVLPSAG